MHPFVHLFPPSPPNPLPIHFHSLPPPNKNLQLNARAADASQGRSTKGSACVEVMTVVLFFPFLGTDRNWETVHGGWWMAGLLLSVRDLLPPTFIPPLPFLHPTST